MSLEPLSTPASPPRPIGPLRRVADLFLPPLCLGCGTRLDAHATLCAACWRALDFIEPPLCPISGLPFAYDPGPGALHASVVAEAPPYQAARFALRYNDAAARLVSRLKYGDRGEAVPLFARLMARAGQQIADGVDLVLPVPLHPTRLRQRRFNQSAELARALAPRLGLPVAVDVVERHRATPRQVGLTRTQRKRNVRGAFRLCPGQGEKVRDKTLLLVDDVVTTGATIEACARALAREGAAEIRVLALARVVPGEASLI